MAPSIWTSQPSTWQRFLTSLAQWLLRQRSPSVTPSLRNVGPSPLSVVCISDTHGTTPELPEGDLLLHAGDLTNDGSFEEIQAQLNWLKALPHKYKVVIAGNHDVLLDPKYVAQFPDRIYEGKGTSRSDLDWGDVVYLNNSTARLEFSNGRMLNVYGSPLTEQFGTWAFQYPPIRDVWTDSVPRDTDVLLTHGPPKGHLDLDGKGCPQILREIWRARPRLVVFGHIHAGHGREDITYDVTGAAYNGVVAGDRGLRAICIMAAAMVCTWLSNVLGRQQGASRAAILINAAVVAGRGNRDSQPATVVEL